MKSADFYDWVIMGDHPAGQWLLAALVSDMGNRANQSRGRVAWVLSQQENTTHTPNYSPEQLDRLCLHWQQQGVDVLMGSWRFVTAHEVASNQPDFHQNAPLSPVIDPSLWSKSAGGKALQILDLPATQPLQKINLKRTLYASHWVMAMATTSVRRVMGLEPPNYELAANLLRSDAAICDIALLGDQPEALPLAQRLAQSGYGVTLVLQQSRLLPQIDPEVVQILQAYLEVQGIKLSIGGRLTAVRVLANHQTRFWVGQNAIDTGRLVLAAPSRLWLTDNWQLPTDVLWCQCADDYRKILLLQQKSASWLDWRWWLDRCGISMANMSQDLSSPELDMSERLLIPTDPPVVHYGVLGEAAYRLILPESNAPLGMGHSVAKIQVTDGKIVGFSGIGQASLSLSQIMGWLIAQKTSYGQWQRHQRYYPEI